MATEYHVFLVTGDHLSGPHRKSEVAERAADKFRNECPCEGDIDCANDEYGSHGISVTKSVDGYWDHSY
jgi:hypothetical protein